MNGRHHFLCAYRPLEPGETVVTLEPIAQVGTHVTTITGGAVVSLICFNSLAEATSAAEGLFKQAFSHEGVAFVVSTFFPDTFGRLLGSFPTCQIFSSWQPR
jgi:hypothetical protein